MFNNRLETDCERDRWTVVNLVLGVAELFPGIDFSYVRLTIITLSHKNYRQLSEHETENAVKTVNTLVICEATVAALLSLSVPFSNGLCKFSSSYYLRKMSAKSYGIRGIGPIS